MRLRVPLRSLSRSSRRRRLASSTGGWSRRPPVGASAARKASCAASGSPPAGAPCRDDEVACLLDARWAGAWRASPAALQVRGVHGRRRGPAPAPAAAAAPQAWRQQRQRLARSTAARQRVGAADGPAARSRRGLQAQGLRIGQLVDLAHVGRVARRRIDRGRSGVQVLVDCEQEVLRGGVVGCDLQDLPHRGARACVVAVGPRPQGLRHQSDLALRLFRRRFGVGKRGAQDQQPADAE
jgi:hypothetical protein